MPRCAVLQGVRRGSVGASRKEMLSLLRTEKTKYLPSHVLLCAHIFYLVTPPLFRVERVKI